MYASRWRSVTTPPAASLSNPLTLPDPGIGSTLGAGTPRRSANVAAYSQRVTRRSSCGPGGSVAAHDGGAPPVPVGPIDPPEPTGPVEVEPAPPAPWVEPVPRFRWMTPSPQ